MNRNTFEYIFNLYYQPLCRYLYLYTKDLGLIEDSVQHVFLSLWEKWQSLEIRHVKTYLFTSAKNRILNEIRNNNRRLDILETYIFEELSSANAEEIIDYEEFYAVLYSAINTLPEKARHIYRLSREKGLSHKEIASLENISHNTVENHISNALRLIRQAIASFYSRK